MFLGNRFFFSQNLSNSVKVFIYLFIFFSISVFHVFFSDLQRKKGDSLFFCRQVWQVLSGSFGPKGGRLSIFNDLLFLLLLFNSEKRVFFVCSEPSFRLGLWGIKMACKKKKKTRASDVRKRGDGLYSFYILTDYNVFSGEGGEEKNIYTNPKSSETRSFPSKIIKGQHVGIK